MTGARGGSALVATMVLAASTYNFQQLMVVPTLASTQQDLHTTTAWITWVLTAFLLASCVGTPLLTKLGDRFGRKRLLLVCLGVFLLATVGAALATSVWALIACRFLAGASGAIVPLSISIMRAQLPPAAVGSALALQSSAFLLAGGLGVVLAGVLIDVASWRLLFALSAASIAVAIVLVHRVVAADFPARRERLDVRGAALLTGSLLAVLLALTEGARWGWTSGAILGLFAASAVGFAAFGAWELRTPEPMVDLRMLGGHTMLMTNVTAFLGPGLAMTAVMLLVPRFVSAHGVGYGFGAGLAVTGLYLVPVCCAGVVAGPVTAAVGRRWGWRWILGVGMALMALGIVGLVLWHDRPWQVLATLTIIGLGVPTASAANAKLIVDNAPPESTGLAAGINAVSRQVGGVLGAQLVAAILVSRTIGDTSVAAESAYTTAFTLGAVCAVAGTVTGLLTAPRRSSGRLVPARARR
jgi:MFS family permease